MSVQRLPRIVKNNRASSKTVLDSLHIKAQDFNPVIDRLNNLQGIEKSGNNYTIEESNGVIKNIIGLVYTQTTSVTVANTVTETSLLTSTTTFPADFFTQYKQILIRLRGYMSRTAAATLRIKIYLNSTAIFDTGAVGGQDWTNNYFDVDAVFNCRSIGTSGTIMGQGFALLYQQHEGMINTSPVTINTTIPQVFNITATWGTADASDTITATNGFLQLLK